MNAILSAFVIAAGLLPQISENICKYVLDVLTDPVEIENCSLSSAYGHENSADMRELYDRVPVSDEEAAGLLATLTPEGCWTDIDYADKRRSGWDPQQHAIRIRRMAVCGINNGREDMIDAAMLAMRWWFANGPTCRNWWYNEIGVPRELAPVYLLLRDRMTQEDIDGAVATLSKSHRNFSGQNKVWVSGVALMRGLLTDDEALVREMRERIVSEIKVTDGEGLQDDNSFHQHGPQLQFGNYGLSYACALCEWAKFLGGTELALSNEQIETLRSFVKEGLRWVVWNGYFDMNACARQVFTNTQKGKAVCAANAVRNLGIGSKPFRGARYYPRSDFGVFRSRKWYASIRMQSNRTKGFETTNSENMKGYFTADGALMVRREGNEYNNISPCWEWKHIPGTTTYDDGKPLWGTKKEIAYNMPGIYNKSGMVSGKCAHGMMAAAMDYDRDSLRAHKLWVFWDGGVVCLGSGISMEIDDYSVTTTVEQNLLQGPVETADTWVRHRGITYISLDSQKMHVADTARTGMWSYVGPFYNDDPVTMDIFEITIPHGTSVRDASYAYGVSPLGMSGKRAARKFNRKVRILENSAARQAVRIGRRTVSVDWSTGEICL